MTALTACFPCSLPHENLNRSSTNHDRNIDHAPAQAVVRNTRRCRAQRVAPTASRAPQGVHMKAHMQLNGVVCLCGASVPTRIGESLRDRSVKPRRTALDA
eukprot:CAMPEP_0174855178 /NCGR_PEP_ID=MMETSP1114-20130205/32637_1 /TAXON_ID=312471 /ORGANISM="Neobodo designis, Strain CCAP 1951/1" /LENGTH=100 /DNA_ID=CAMNT_0016089905 /DNA_START=205 /DNA_END=506 /DNA_ORIENTATION=+